MVAWGYAPSEFWTLTPAEWWRIYEMKRPRDPEFDFAGDLRETDVRELYEMLH